MSNHLQKQLIRNTSSTECSSDQTILDLLRKLHCIIEANVLFVYVSQFN